MTDELIEVDDAVRLAFEAGRQDVLRGLKALAELNGTGVPVVDLVQKATPNRIEKAYIESQHPRDRNGQWIEKGDIDRLSQSEAGRQHLLNIVRPQDRMAMVRAIQASQNQKQHGMPNVWNPRDAQNEHTDPWTGKPGKVGSDELKQTLETLHRAQQLIANVKNGDMQGDPASMERMLGAFLHGLPPKVFHEVREHIGAHAGHDPAALAKYVATGIEAGTPEAAKAAPKKPEDPFGMPTNAERDKAAAAKGEARPNSVLDDFFAEKTPEKKPAAPDESGMRKNDALDAAMGMEPAPPRKPTNPPLKPLDFKRKPQYGPWSPDDLMEATKPLNREMDEANTPEAFHKAATEYAQFLKQFSRSELEGLAKELGSELDADESVAASRLAVTALGRQHPAEGHTGVVHGSDGSQTHYVAGQIASHTPAGEEEKPATPEGSAREKERDLGVLEGFDPAEWGGTEADNKPTPGPDQKSGPADIDTISHFLSNPTKGMRDKMAVRERLSRTLVNRQDIRAVGKKVLGNYVDKLMPHPKSAGKDEVVGGEEKVLDRLAEFAAARAERVHGRVQEKEPDARQKAEALKMKHEGATNIERAMTSAGQGTLDAVQTQREQAARDMAAHLEENPDLATEYGKYTKPEAHDESERQPGDESPESLEGSTEGDGPPAQGSEPAHPQPFEHEHGITPAGSLEHRPGEGPLTAARQGKKWATAWQTWEGHDRHALFDSEEDAKTHAGIMSRDKNVLRGTARTIAPGSLNKPEPKYDAKNPAIQEGTVAREVIRSGGLDPDAFERMVGPVKDAIESGVPRAVFYPGGRKGTGHVDTLSESLISEGHLSHPGEDVHAGEHLMNHLAGGKMTPEGMAAHGERLAREHQKELEFAHAEERRRSEAGLDSHTSDEIEAARSFGETAGGMAAEGPGAQGKDRYDRLQELRAKFRKPKDDTGVAESRVNEAARGPGFKGAESTAPKGGVPVKNAAGDVTEYEMPGYRMSMTRAWNVANGFLVPATPEGKVDVGHPGGPTGGLSRGSAKEEKDNQKVVDKVTVGASPKDAKAEVSAEKAEPSVKYHKHGDGSWTARVEYPDGRVFVHTNKDRGKLAKLISDRFGKFLPKPPL